MRAVRFRDFAGPITPNLRRFRFASPLPTHLSRLAASGSGRLYRKQVWQSAQIDRQHGQREHIAHLLQTAQLDLPDGAAVLFAIAKQRLDHLAYHLADGVPGMPRRARIDPAPAPHAFAGLGVLLVSVLRYVRGDLAFATSRDESGGVVIPVRTDGLALPSIFYPMPYILWRWRCTRRRRVAVNHITSYCSEKARPQGAQGAYCVHIHMLTCVKESCDRGGNGPTAS